MKTRKALLFLLAALLMVNCLAVTSFAATTKTITTGTILYSQNFEGETAADGKAPTTIKYFDNGNKSYEDIFTGLAVVAKNTTTTDPASLGNKYILTGVSEKNGDMTSGDQGRIGGAFSQPVSSGTIAIEFDANITDDPAISGEYVQIGLTSTSGNVWPFSVNTVTRQIGNTLQGAGGVIATTNVTKNGVWQHYIVTVDLTNNKSSISVDGKEYNFDSFASNGWEFIGFSTYSGTASNMALDNIVIRHNPSVAGTITTYVDDDLEDGTAWGASILAAVTDAAGNLVDPSVVSVKDISYGSIETTKGLYDNGNYAYNIGHNRIYKHCVIADGIKDGLLTVEFDIQPGAGGVAVAFGSSATGGGIGGKIGMVLYRNSKKVFYQNETGTGYQDFYNDGYLSQYTSYIVDGTEDVVLTYNPYKWNHVIMEIEPQTGKCVLSIDGVRSKPVVSNNFMNITSVCTGFRNKVGEAYDATLHNVYIDNLKIVHKTDMDFRSIDTADGKVLVTMKKAIGSVAKGDVSLVGTTVTDVETSGNKILITASGLANGASYVAALSNNVKYADGTELTMKSCEFTYTPAEFGAAAGIAIGKGIDANNAVPAFINIIPSFEDKAVEGYVAAYDGNGDLVGAYHITDNVSKFDTLRKAVKLNLELEDGAAATVKKVKAFSWNAEMTPYSPADEVNVASN